MSAFGQSVLRALGISRGTLSVVFVSERKMREINRRYRDRDYATDVLSFEYGTATAEGSPLLGEVVIAPQVAWRQAVRWHSRPERELRRLLVHGILHLLGYDHETDSGTMDSLQRRLLRRKSLTRAVLAEESAERK